MSTLTDPVRPVVAEFATDCGGTLSRGDETADDDIAWSYFAETTRGQFHLIRFNQEYATADGETVEMPPVLTARVVSYDDETPVPPGLMAVIEDDPNGFQKDVADLSVEYREDTRELTFLLAEMNLPDTPLQRVTLRQTDDGFRVLEDVTEMG